MPAKQLGQLFYNRYGPVGTEMLLTPFIFLLMMCIASIFGYVILEPVAKAARGKQWTSRFCLSDFFSLSLLLAIPLVIVAAVRPLHEEDSAFVNVVSVMLIGVFAYAWWRGTVTLSRIGVIFPATIYSIMFPFSI